MEYLVFWGVLIGVLILLVVKEAWNGRKRQKQFEAKLFSSYGKLPEREYQTERFERLDRYFRKHPEEGQIDDITWNDLGMDEVFMLMNHSLSSTGEEYLYYTLRTPRSEEAPLSHLEEMVRYFGENDRQRADVQLMMHQLGTMGKYSLYDYLEYLGNLGRRSNLAHIVRILVMLSMIPLLFLNTAWGIVGLVLLITSNIVTYFKEKGEIEPYIVSFSYIIRLLDVCDRIVKLPLPVCKQEWENIELHKKNLASMKRGAFWVLSGGNAGISGNPLEILMDYVRMAFHVDLIVFNKMLSQLNLHLEDVDGLVTELGKVETAVCIAAYRASVEKTLGNVWCVPAFTSENRIEMEEGYHPLIEEPVKNSISASRGVLLTGSNASGKSTFLKTVALNAILAQTIHTCPADRYEAPFYRILSSMALRDDLEGGESYYIVEIKSLKRILDAAEKGERVLCFVDEVLRGTNTVERIAASSQILKSLDGRNILCFAATHDIELTELLKEHFDNYHFEEEIRDGDINFNYKLMKGKATTRNAIKLLELIGYEDRIIREATRQAERFLQTGEWRMDE